MRDKKRFLCATTTTKLCTFHDDLLFFSSYSRLEKKMTYATVMFRTVLVK
jgi:hypothetical protein